MPFTSLALTAAAVLYLVTGYARAPKTAPYPAYGFVGLAVIIAAEAALFLDVRLAGIYFTPLAWTGYILAVDAAVFRLRGRSAIKTEPQAFVWMVVLSIFSWLIFEGYNLHLRNWIYVGLPNSVIPRYLGYGWSFATIWPGVLETSELLLATWFRNSPAPPEPAVPAKAPVVPIVAGIAMLAVPPLMPPDIAVYLFGPVWLGFILVLDPLNYRARRPSLWGDWAHGYKARSWALLTSGLVCGLLWEFWNYWASSKWLYIFEILPDWRLFEMPLIGFLGFPAFGLEIFAMYVFATALLNLPCYEIGAAPDDPLD